MSAAAALSLLFVATTAQVSWAARKGELEWAERRIDEIRDRGYRGMAADQLQFARTAPAQGNEGQCLESVRAVDRFSRWGAISRPSR
jgi:hypothetical protein